MRLVSKSFGSVSSTFAKVYTDSQSGGTTGDVDGGSTCEIETAEYEGPAVGVPSPTGDGIIYESGPTKDENEEWTETAAFCDCSDGEDGCDGSEHELVDAEDERGNSCASDGRGAKYALETEVFWRDG